MASLAGQTQRNSQSGGSQTPHSPTPKLQTTASSLKPFGVLVWMVNTHPDSGAFGLSSLGLCSWVCMLSNPSTSRAVDTNRACSPGSLLDAVKQADKEDVAGQLVHAALHKRATFRAPQLTARSHNAKQAAAAEGMLARQYLGGGVQPF